MTQRAMQLSQHQIERLKASSKESLGNCTRFFVFNTNCSVIYSTFSVRSLTSPPSSSPHHHHYSSPCVTHRSQPTNSLPHTYMSYQFSPEDILNGTMAVSRSSPKRMTSRLLHSSVVSILDCGIHRWIGRRNCRASCSVSARGTRPTSGDSSSRAGDMRYAGISRGTNVQPASSAC